jgi:hypothetical protein
MLGFFFSFYEVGVVNNTNCEHFPIFTPYKSFELVWIALSAGLFTGSNIISLATSMVHMQFLNAFVVVCL